MIVRTERNDYRRQQKASGPVQRADNDPDLSWGGEHGEMHRVYVLDDHEYFDPQTSTKGRHMMHGPSVIVVYDSTSGRRTNEHYVNDPEVWAWVRRCILEGFLSAESMSSGIHNDEVLIEIGD